MALKQTPSQTIGPFFAYGLTPEQYGYAFTSIAGNNLAQTDCPGKRVRIEGRVLDGAGQPVSDAMIEIWQADGEGRYAHPADSRADRAFAGFGRMGTGSDPENRFIFETIKPGAPGAGQAPHINVVLFMRGMLSHAYTRIYFSDEAAANAEDLVLSAVPAERRDSLIARREETPDGVVYRLDIHMQGDFETVFFDV